MSAPEPRPEERVEDDRPLGEEPADPGGWLSHRVVLGFFLACTLVVLTASLAVYRWKQRELLEDAKQHLSVIANLKISQISDWRRQRLGDAAAISCSPWNEYRLLPFLENASPGDAGADILAWMETLRCSYGYRDLVLFDSEGHRRLSAGITEPDVDKAEQRDIRAVIRSGKPRLADFRRSDVTGHIHLRLYAPMLRRKGSGTEAVCSSDSVCAGVLMLDIDPDTFLYPLIQTWPTPSPTAETLLVRREGEEVVFLNELRHRPHSALSLRFPAIDESLPAAMLVRGRRGMVEGTDYRGIHVLAALLPIPDSPWGLVAKQDYQEVIAPFQAVALIIVLLSTGSLLIVGLSILVWWKRREVGFYRSQYRLEQERRNAVEALRRSEAHLCRLLADREEFRSALLNCVSHELRTPLAALTGAASTLLENEVQIAAPTRKALLQSMYDEADRLGQLVRNVLDMSRLESGSTALKRRWQPLEELIGAALNSLDQPLTGRVVKLDLPDGLLLIRVDAVLIERVMAHLLENAAKYSADGSPIEVSVTVGSSEVVVAVADRGPGVPPDERDRIFEKFYRSSRDRSYAGTGLGLSICRAILKVHEGRVWVEDRPGGGAVFKFALPREDAPSDLQTQSLPEVIARDV